MASSNERNSTEKTEQHVNVYVRIRPFNEEEVERKSSSCIDVVSNTALQIRQLYSRKTFHFESIFKPSSSQSDVFNNAVQPLVVEVLKGYNCTVFAYGQTGSGKTHTIIGSKNENAGIIPRSVSKLFDLLKENELESNIRVSFLEIYNEELFDLLSIDNTKTIKLFEDKSSKGSVIVQGLEEVTVNTKDEIYNYLEAGYEKRRTASTLMNTQSSRSHCIFSIIVHIRERTSSGDDLVKTGKLNLVDLAGSENIGRSGSIDKRAREAGSINQSLLTLGRVIRALTEKSSHIPYRESKLTRILSDSLGGSAKTSLIATISSATSNAEETANTLDYAIKVRNIQNRPEVNQHLSRTALIHQYIQEIEKLKKDLAACRTGNGISLNEDIYLQMINNREDIMSDLNVKADHIASLEEKIKSTTENLEIVQSSWADAANNIERLTQEHRILNENLILSNNENENQRQKLENFIMKHEQLRSDAKVLASAVKVQYQNEDILHKKISSLYDVAYHNQMSVRDFYDMYNSLNCEMERELDSCVNFIQNVRDTKMESAACLKTKLKETYSALKKIMTNIGTNWDAVNRNTDNYLNVKDALMLGVSQYINELNKIIEDTFPEVLVNIGKGSHECLKKLQSNVQTISDGHKNYYDALSSALQNIGTCVTHSSNKISNLLEQAQQNINSKTEAMENLNQDMKRNMSSCISHTVENEKNFESEVASIRNQILKMRERHSKSVKVRQQINKNFEQIATKMSETCQDLQTAEHNYHDLMKNETKQFSDQTHSAVNKQTGYLGEIQKKESSLCETTIKNINATISSIEEQKHRTEKVYGNFQNSVSEFKSGIQENGITCDMHVAELNESCYCTNDRAAEALIMIDNVQKATSDITSQITSVLEDGNSKLTSTNDSLHQNYDQMKKLMNDFSNLKLKCPTHVGDTPQRSQAIVVLNSNLNISSSGDDSNGIENCHTPQRNK